MRNAALNPVTLNNQAETPLWGLPVTRVLMMASSPHFKHNMTTLKHEGDEIIRLFHGRPESTVCQFASYIEAEQYGNLFASAPDLYAALEAMLSCAEAGDMDSMANAAVAARKALDKANG